MKELKWVIPVLMPQRWIDSQHDGWQQHYQNAGKCHFTRGSFAISESLLERYVSKTPLNRMATEDDFRGVFAYLASDQSSYAGQVISVDGWVFGNISLLVLFSVAFVVGLSVIEFFRPKIYYLISILGMVLQDVENLWFHLL